MTVFKVTVKSMFYVEADKMWQAKSIVDKAIAKLPNAECNIKATKMVNTDLSPETLT